MKIGIVATHSFPIPSPTHTGDIVILDLAKSLDRLGHDVTLYAPAGTERPGLGMNLEMPASLGKAPPWSWECEQQCFEMHTDRILREDVIHDFSITKRISENLMRMGRKNVISTLLGGTWGHPDPGVNIVVWSQAMRERGLRGATDFEGTPTPDMGGPRQKPIKDARVVHGGIDTQWYVPDYPEKKNFFLWMNRWHPAKGYQVAIELARKTGIELVMAGENPENEMFEYQKKCALEAVAMAKGLPNVSFRWLPSDPHHHEAKRELYQQAKALLYTVQFQEPFGLSQAEALACGTPVIGTNFGSVPEVIRDGETGFVCENDLVSFARATEKISLIDELRCRADAVARFDREVMAKNYLTLYKEILAGGGWGL